MPRAGKQGHGRQAQPGVESIEFGPSGAELNEPGCVVEKAGEDFEEIRLHTENEPPDRVGGPHRHRRGRRFGVPDPGQNRLDLTGERAPVSCAHQKFRAFSMQNPVSEDHGLRGRGNLSKLRTHDHRRLAVLPDTRISRHATARQHQGQDATR